MVDVDFGVDSNAVLISEMACQTAKGSSCLGESCSYFIVQSVCAGKPAAEITEAISNR